MHSNDFLSHNLENHRRKPGQCWFTEWGTDHEKFKLETQELFKMVLSRIQNETELLYLLVREIGKVAA